MINVRDGWHRWAVALAATTLVLGVAGCGGEDPAPVPANSSDSSTDTPSTSPDPEPTQDETSTEPVPETEQPAPLNHDDALTAGFDGSEAITCGYTFDEQEISEMEMISTSGTVNPEAIIHLHGSTVHWEMTEPDEQIAHVLAHDGQTYAWKVPGDGGGLQSEDESEDLLGELAERMNRNAHDCQMHTGPASDFEVPSDITFDSFEDLLEG